MLKLRYFPSLKTCTKMVSIMWFCFFTWSVINILRQLFHLEFEQDMKMPAKMTFEKTSQRATSNQTGSRIPNIPYYQTLRDWPEDGSRNVKDFINVRYQNSLATPSKEIEEKVQRKDQIPSSTILILVQSAPKNFASRQEVRSTWGKSCNKDLSWCAMAFSLGTTRNGSVQERLYRESAFYGDILQDNFVDSYNNLTVKTLHILRYFVHSDFGNLLKTDDDSFINLHGLKALIEDKVLKEKQSLIGDLQLRAGGNRHNKTSSSEVWGPGPSVHRYYEKMSPRVQKWAVPKYMYKWSSFPVFLSGSGYVIGGKEAANCLLTESHKIGLVHLEDVYTTGLCAEACNLTRFNHPGFDYREKPKAFRIQAWNILVHRCNGRMHKFQQELTQLQITTDD